MTGRVCSGTLGFIGKDDQGCLMITGDAHKAESGVVVDSSNNVHVSSGSLEVSRGNVSVLEGSLNVASDVTILKGTLAVLNGSIGVENGNLSVTGNTILKGPLKVLDGSFTVPEQPAFSAYLSANLNSQTGTGVIARFAPNIVSFNKGGGYDPTTGEFTAPTSGLYWLACKITVGVPNYPEVPQISDTLQLVVGSNPPDTHYWTASTYFSARPTTRKISGIYEMREGEVAYCAMIVSRLALNAVSFLGDSSNQMSRFSGYLLH